MYKGLSGKDERKMGGKIIDLIVGVVDAHEQASEGFLKQFNIREKQDLKVQRVYKS